LQQPREIDRSLADSLAKADRTVLGAEVLDGGDTPVGATIACRYENIGRSACSSTSDCRSVPPVAAISTGISDSVSSGSASKNDLNSALNEALKAGEEPDFPFWERTRPIPPSMPPPTPLPSRRFLCQPDRCIPSSPVSRFDRWPVPSDLVVSDDQARYLFEKHTHRVVGDRARSFRTSGAAGRADIRYARPLASRNTDAAPNQVASGPL
jgi:hypothetical protein